MDNNLTMANNDSWTIAENCTCPTFQYCIRPLEYKKPLLCISNNIPLNNFENFLINPPTIMDFNLTLLIILCVILFFEVNFLPLKLNSIFFFFVNKRWLNSSFALLE